MQTPWLLNAHEWYRLATFGDHVRLVLWTMTNLGAAVSYWALAVEFDYWRRASPFRVSKLIAIAFIVVTGFCGVHHVVDVMIMATAPWWAIATGNLPMVISAAWLAWVLRSRRALLLKVILDFAALYHE